MLWFVLYVLQIWGTVRYGLFVYRVAKGEENVYQFDQTDMVPMHFQSVGDSAPAFPHVQKTMII